MVVSCRSTSWLYSWHGISIGRWTFIRQMIAWLARIHFVNDDAHLHLSLFTGCTNQQEPTRSKQEADGKFGRTWDQETDLSSLRDRWCKILTWNYRRFAGKQFTDSSSTLFSPEQRVSFHAAGSLMYLPLRKVFHTGYRVHVLSIMLHLSLVKRWRKQTAMHCAVSSKHAVSLRSSCRQWRGDSQLSNIHGLVWISAEQGKTMSFTWRTSKNKPALSAFECKLDASDDEENKWTPLVRFGITC